MLLDKKAIDGANHILLVTNNDTFANASAVYTYILTLHKKVSLLQLEKIDESLSFLPWFDKLKLKAPSSADYTLEISSDTECVFDFFKKNGININKKMATALYAGVLKRYDAFLSNDCNGIIFAITSELIGLNAEYKLCNKQILKNLPLSLFRLKTIMFKSMLLKKNATYANLYISEEELKASGSELKETEYVMREALNLVHVKEVTLFKSDENNKILKIIKEN